MIALYGHPQTKALGMLGEQPPDQAVRRARSLAKEYTALSKEPVIPAFELIASVASQAAGKDGSYSRRTPIEVLLPWVEAAEQAGIYVVIDLQPGRTDFLTQAKFYEPLLRRPFVGLALDPEWRLEPDQKHLRQIGSVDRIPEYIKKAKDPSDAFRLMGFGHRVYKNYDPRAKIMQKTTHEVLSELGVKDDPLLDVAMELERFETIAAAADTVRDLGLQGETLKVGTPTMGGIIIIAATFIPCLLMARLDNVYILLMLFATIWMATIGFIDDYIKVFKKDKEGLKARG